MITKSMTFAAALICASVANAENWTLVGDASKVAFGSIKNEVVGEAHHFNDVAGSVSDNGDVSIEIGLTSVETWVDIRNERMGEFVFKGADKATLTAAIDMDQLQALGVGDTAVMDIEGALSLLGTETAIDAPMFVARVAEDKVLVTTDEMLFLDMEDAGLNDGISKLMELAELPSITRSSPITLRFMFQSGA